MRTQRYRLTLLSALSLLWLLPFFWAGSTLGRLPFRVPTRLWQQYTAAALFTKRTPTWSDWQIEVRTNGGAEWQPVSMEDVSPMPTSGNRQRVDRILGDTRSKKIGVSLRQRMAAWLATRLKHENGQEVTGVRFLLRSWMVNTPEMALADGHWEDDANLPATTRVTVKGAYAMIDGMAVLEPSVPPKPRAETQPQVFRRAQGTSVPDKS